MGRTAYVATTTTTVLPSGRRGQRPLPAGEYPIAEWDGRPDDVMFVHTDEGLIQVDPTDRAILILDPDADPYAPGNDIAVPFVNPDLPAELAAGFVVGRCGHRVARSEWMAGFRVCERCTA